MKPEFFRHELLQDLEEKNPGNHIMLVFCGLWGHCDREGRFLWRPRVLKLDILPFLNFSMEKTLDLLEQNSLVMRYSADGIEYGCIPTFTEHQAIGGKESTQPAKYPEPSKEAMGKWRGKKNLSLGSDGAVTETAGREGKGTRKEGLPDLFPKFWEAYPRKVAKQDAIKAFRKLAFVNGDFQKLLAALDEAKGSRQWQKNDGEFIPHPATWLNGRRWEDEGHSAKPIKVDL